MSIFLLSAVGIIFAFGIVIFVHEFGHFLVAKKSGVKVERFSFGLGPEMFGFQWGETRYCVAWLPLGGEVRMAGEFPNAEEGADPQQSRTPADGSDHSRDFYAKPWTVRIAIAVAGPFMNYVLAVVIFLIMLLVWGEPIQTNKTEVGEVVPGLPAAAAGLQKGDRIVSVQGEPVEDFMSLAMKIHARPEQKTEIAFKRVDQLKTLSVVPIREPGKGIGLIGIRPAEPVHERRMLGPVEAAKKSVYQCWNITRFTLYYLGQKIWLREKPDVAGPIGIGQVIVKAVKAGMEDFLYLIAMISVAIGLFNLFPIPLLDGGHVAYYVIEGARGKPLSQKTMSRANVAGLAFLLSLLVFATFNDVQRFKGPAPTASAPAAPATEK